MGIKILVYSNDQSGEPQSLNQASFDPVKVGPTPVLALQNLGRQIYMFLDILVFSIEN